MPPLLRCHRCQRYGHHQNNCKATYPICGICSKRHDTAICLTKYKADEPTTAKCPQCRQSHHSWNKRCTERLKREYARRNQTPSNSNAAGSQINKPAQQQPGPRIADINCHDANTLSIQITLLNTTLTIHNIYRPPASVLDANLLFAAAETQDTIISGDFNAHHPFLKSPSLTNSTGDHLHSLLEEFPGVKLLNNVDIPTHIAGGRLDLTFVSQNLRHGSTWDLHPILTSDYYGTVSSFRLEKLPDPPPPPRRWNPDFANWELFEQHMTTWAERYSVGPPEDSDNILLSLNNQLNEAAASSMPKKKSFVERS
ncbi:uncharacterized protein [Palaemon carinicauda]|uniref:uncharacterized protein n=1 Tax=Palaemon carinicauda TaxID=392227 RepID=UPI0035B5B953